MKKIYLNILCLAGALLLLSGCKEFLDVNPKGEVFDGDMFTSAEGYEDALYGVYSELASDQYLYAGYFHWIPEACSQNVTCLGDYKLGNMALGDWYTIGPESVRESVWSDAYEVINHINNIISHAEEGGFGEFEHSGLYAGEAYALRALVHFELARLFAAPFRASDSEKAEAIPYVTKYSFDITPFSSVDETFDKILTDLKKAESLMAADESLLAAKKDNVATGFTSCRITHLNLYAVQALIARVYWTTGDLKNAALYAGKVIESGKFSFRSHGAFVQPDNGTLDLNETIFGLYSESYQTANATKYGLSGTSTTSFELADDWKNLYENGSSSTRTDYRLNAWFDDGDGKLTKLVNSTFFENGSSSYSGNSILGVNVLRLPEMYFIMAEANLDSDPSGAEKWFDAVIVSRGLDALGVSGLTLTKDLLFQERRKEYYGEGFTWHDMKRLGKDITTTGGAVLSGSLTSTYVVPIPDSEYEGRNDLD